MSASAREEGIVCERLRPEAVVDEPDLFKTVQDRGGDILGHIAFGQLPFQLEPALGRAGQLSQHNGPRHCRGVGAPVFRGCGRQRWGRRPARCWDSNDIPVTLDPKGDRMARHLESWQGRGLAARAAARRLRWLLAGWPWV